MCNCIIAHPTSREERARVVEALNYAKRVGDTAGIMLAIAQLQGCPNDR